MIILLGFSLSTISYFMAEGGVFIGRVLKFLSEETDQFPHYRKLFYMAASGVNIYSWASPMMKVDH